MEAVIELSQVFEMWKGAVVLISVLAVTAAFQALAPLEAKPDKFKDQPGCYMAEFDKVMPFGSTRPSIKTCVEYHCGQKNVIISGCGAVVGTPPLRVVQDESKPYPGCCPMVVGPEKQYTRTV